VEATATWTGRKSAKAGIRSVPRPKPGKRFRSETPKAKVGRWK
jgi:hypothetical protein